MNEPKKLVLLGATGSIGTSTLRVIRKHPEKIKLVGISAHSKTEQLLEIAKEFEVPYASIVNKTSENYSVPKNIELFLDLNHSKIWRPLRKRILFWLQLWVQLLYFLLLLPLKLVKI